MARIASSMMRVRECVEEFDLASDVPVERGGLHAETAGEGPKAEGVEALIVGQSQGLVDDLLPIQRHEPSLRDLSYSVRHRLTL